MNDKQGDTGIRWTWQFTVAIVLLVAFLALVGVMMWNADAGTETVWQRRVYLFGAVEAIVFTAVGWLFGSEVHRADAQNARQDATAAKQEAKQNAEAAAVAEKQLTAEQEKANTVATVVRHTETATAGDAKARQGRSGDINVGPAQPAQPAPATINLRALFDELYPKGD